MQIIIIGGGEIGYALAKALASDHELCMVDSEPGVADRFALLDVEFLTGSGTSSSLLERARVSTCDLLIACTGLDVVNIVACSIGSQLGCRRTICFVSKEDFVQTTEGRESLSEHFGIDRLRQGLFQTLSILTTTGYASVDFQLWGDQTRMILLTLMFIGGCAGSAAGGPKVIRHLLIGRYTLTELRRTLHPRGVLPVKIGGKVVPDDVMRTVLVFFLFYILTTALCVMAVVLLGADLITGITATMATLGNVGPGLGQVGPMANYGHLHPMSKLVLTGAMWIGRLEVLTVLALLRPEVWQSAHWRSAARR